ncbi:MAG TPA: hypothetical protein VFS55_04560 [Dokdonella sp.]|nr:hypothetical protein [Dokdonella sp.]
MCIALRPAMLACGIAAVLAIVADAAPCHASALGSHTLLAHEDGNGPSIATTAPIATAATGSTLIAFSAGYTANDQPPTDTYGNTWVRFGDPVFYRGYDGQFDVTAYLVLHATGGATHTVSVVKNGVPAGEITIPFIEVGDAGLLQDSSVNYPDAGTSLRSGDVTTTGPATLVAFWWGDATGLHHSAVPGDGFTLIENFVDLPPNSAVQCAVAVREVAGAGTYHVTWATTPAQGAPLWLFAVQSGGDTIFTDGFDGAG